MQLGAKHVESPFIEFGQISTVLYFLYFIVVMYGTTSFENTFVGLNHNMNLLMQYRRSPSTRVIAVLGSRPEAVRYLK